MNRQEFLLDLLNTLIDDRISLFGYRETLDYLIDYGCSEDLLIEELQFDGDDVRETIKNYEENKENY